jgi:hypothetical protein
MVIFHSYVSLPEGNQVGMTNRDFWSSWTCQILSGPSPGVQNPRRALGIRQGRRVVHQLQELERPGTLGWSEYSGDQRSTSKKGRWIFYMGFMNVLWMFYECFMMLPDHLNVLTSQGSSTNGSPAVWIWLCFGTVDVHGFAGIPCTAIILSCDFSGGSQSPGP